MSYKVAPAGLNRGGSKVLKEVATCSERECFQMVRIHGESRRVLALQDHNSGVDVSAVITGWW